MKVKIFTLITFCLTITCLQAQSLEVLDNEKKFLDFKFDEVIDPTTTDKYELDTKRSTTVLKAYQYKGNKYTDFKGIHIDGVILYLNMANKLAKIEFLINDVKPLAAVGTCFSKVQSHYGLYSDYLLATGSKTTSSFFWQSNNYELVVKITPTDESKQNYRTKLYLSQRVSDTKLESKD